MKLPEGSDIGRQAIAALLAAGCAALAQCGGNPVQPPPPPPPNTAPVIRGVTPNRTQVDAGQEVEVTAVADDAETPADQLQYVWTAEPAGGTFTGAGRIVRWRAPIDGPVPSDYAIRVTVRDLMLSATSTTPLIRVNDGIREMRQLAETFFTDFSDSTKSAEFCVRNFTDTCRIGKQSELEDIQNNRRDYTMISDKHRIDEVVLNSGWVECTAPTGPQSCALVLTAVDWISISKTTGALRRSRGDSVITGIYEQSTRQWWLCDSRYFEPPTTTQPLMPAFLR
ncbi:MAG: hypothetical protein ACRD1S_09980 [Vicinamibacterales bacterium]